MLKTQQKELTLLIQQNILVIKLLIQQQNEEVRYLEFNLVLIRNRRIELNLSQQELASALGFKDASTYLKYERGEYAFKAKQLPVLAKILQCKVTDFFAQNVA